MTVLGLVIAACALAGAFIFRKYMYWNFSRDNFKEKMSDHLQTHVNKEEHGLKSSRVNKAG